MAIHLPYSLFPILIFVLLDAMATMSEIRGMGIYDVIVLAYWKLSPHIWELVIRLQRGQADPFSDLRIESRGLCVGHDPVSTCDG